MSIAVSSLLSQLQLHAPRICSLSYRLFSLGATEPRKGREVRHERKRGVGAMNYLTWNDRITSNFFRPEMAGRRVHLFVTEDLINELGSPEGVDVRDFIESVKSGPPWVTRQGICQKALQSWHNWRGKGLDYPPYVGYLAFFVLAAGIEGDFAPHAYYPRLRKLLDEEPTSGLLPSFDQMLELWDDLERWSNQDKRGELGSFKIDIAGNWIHVGLPLAQTLLTEYERNALPPIFAKAGLDPASPPSDQELAILLAKYGQQKFKPRTLRLLDGANSTDEALSEVLIEIILEELEEWNGTATNIARSAEHKARIYGILSLCCQVDTTAGYASLSFRCKSKRDFPEDGLLLSLDGYPNRLFCEESAMGWSSPISPESGGPAIDASKFDWSQGLLMEDSDQGWSFSLSPSPIRIFVKGAIYGLPGLVETRRLPKASPFYLAAREECCELLERWGASSCSGFKALLIARGLPQGWRFFYADAAQSDEMVKREYPLLALPSTVRLGFDGGVRISRGHQFFKFAPPRIVLDGGDDAVEIYCNGIRMNSSPIEGIYDLPQAASTSNELAIEAHRNGDKLRRLSLYLVDDFPWPSQTPVKRFGRFGDILPEAGDGLASTTGVLVIGANPPPFNYSTLVETQEERRIFFVGREPGQIICWPSEPLPTTWLPVWAIPMRRSGKAVFCGASISGSEPTRSRCGDRRKLKEWKEVLWHHRRKIAPPKHKSLRSLWASFQEEARDV